MIVARLFVQTGLLLFAMAVVLLVAAGDPAWSAAWAFVLEIGVLALAVGLWLAWRDPVLLAERLGWLAQPSQVAWDRRFMIAAGVAFLAWLALMGLDAGRWRLSLVPPFLQGVGVLLIAFSVWLSWRVFMVNSFAAPQVKLQPGQRVIAAGPYSIVRHPLYAGAFAFFVGAPLMLGSWLGLAATPLFIAGLGARAIGEERMLRAGLPGYEDYAARVRYRFVPRLW
ncbi:MAG: methyltransferase family protein [Caulobacteraceae bacterium]